MKIISSSLSRIVRLLCDIFDASSMKILAAAFWPDFGESSINWMKEIAQEHSPTRRSGAIKLPSEFEPRNSDVAMSKFLITRNSESLSTRDRTPVLAHLQFLDHATRRFVTEQFKLAACTIPPAGSKLGRPIKISDSGVVTNLMALDNERLVSSN
ncbi:uncharacterized protein LOC105831155 isoform X2 [Monomorium pharaonis]|uniref:uncharacterized protein LOC105831155 isoform X2 n=1 Tax=Monomorium pharaonis TaxID=307658 RepID=UPI0017474195|nr:uncharacterized protein LOC105831155 isoform X2 [Monomorium pharaonis]